MEKSIEIDLILAVIEKRHTATKEPVDSKMITEAIAEVFMNHSSDSRELTLTGLARGLNKAINFGKTLAPDTAERVSTKGNVIVSDSYHFKDIDKNVHFGEKAILINREAGVSYLGILNVKDKFSTHYAPYPTFKD